MKMYNCVECGLEKKAEDIKYKNERFGLCKDCSKKLEKLKENNEKEGVSVRFIKKQRYK